MTYYRTHINTIEFRNNKRQEFWNGTLVDDYNFLMSEELICRCQGSLSEPFTSLNDLSVHHVSYNEFEKQYTELAHWCEKIHETITTVSSNALTRYLRQKYYEELYEQGLMRLRVFDQYADKLSERFPDLKLNINDKLIRINRQWNSLESRFLDYLDEDFDRILQDLHSELFLFEEWLSETEEQLSTFTSIRTDDISLEDFQYKLHQHTKLQGEIKSRNSRVSSIIEICDRLKQDYEQQVEQVPFDLASDLENRWHQTWINSVEIQCKLEEKLKILRSPTPFILFDENDRLDEEDDIIPFESSEYEKIPLTASNTSLDSLYNFQQNHKRSESSLILTSNNNLESKSIYLNRNMSRSKRQMSLNLLPINSPSTFYYSLTNINDIDDQINTNEKQKRTLSKLDVGYETEDEINQSDESLRPIFQIKTSQSDYYIGQKLPNQGRTSFSSLTHSLPVLERDRHLPNWWRHSITSAYDTCSNPDIDLSIEEAKKTQPKPSLLMYSKKYTNSKPSPSQLSPSSPVQKKLSSNSYDASAEYTDPEQSENDVDVLSSDFNSTSPIHQYHRSESQYYNRYKTTTTTTTTGYSSDVELETTTTPSEAEEQQTPNLDEVSQMKVDLMTLPMSITSDVFDSLNTIIMNDKMDGSEPCWDGYQNPLFYPLNSHDIDSMETTLKWEDQFLEMDLPNDSSSDNENYLIDNFNYSFKNIHGSSSSLTSGLVGNKELLDSDSDLDDFNYVLNETERQLFKARQSLEKKKRQQPFTLNDRNLRKYDEVLRTCETNIQCLQQILKNLHRSKNSRLNSTKAIEQLQTYLSGWHDMRQQVNDDRIQARQLLYISQEIIKLKLRLDEELSRINSACNHQHPWLNDSSLIEIMRRINYEIESEKDSRQKIGSYRSDILLAEEHLNEYRMSHFDGPSSSNIDEHLHSCRLTLDQLTDKMDTYQSQLRTLSKLIDNLIPIETQIEQKLTSCEYNNNYQIEYQDIQRLMDKYEQLINHLTRSTIHPTTNLHLKIKNHCECKLDLYRKMLNEFVRKSQSKHVSFDGSINLNNNNSSIFHTSSSLSSSTTTPLQYSTQQNTRHKKYRRTTENRTTLNDSNLLYIETVVEVTKPVFYERTNDTQTTTDTEYHHRHHQNPQSTINTQQSTDHYYKIHESSDDESSKPVNSSKTTATSSSTSRTDHQRNKFQQIDSGIEYDRTSLPASSSSSTIYTHQTLNDNSKLLFPPVSTDSIIDETSQSRLLHRLNSAKSPTNETKATKILPRTSYWDRLKQTWFRSLLLGLLILLLLFFMESHEFIKHYVILWLDSNVSHTIQHARILFKTTHHFIDSIKTCLNIDQCIDFLQTITNKHVFLIINDLFHAQSLRNLIRCIEETSQIDSVFVFANSLSEEQSCLNECSKLHGIFPEIEQISSAFKRRIGSSNILTQLDDDIDENYSSYVYSKLLTDMIFQLEYDERGKKETFSFCHEFEQHYHRYSPIWWFIQQSNIPVLIKDALITQNIDMMIKFGIFLRDLHREIKQIHSETYQTTKFTVYHSEQMSPDDFQQCIKHKKGSLYSFHHFLLTSTNRDVALRSTRSDKQNIRILFEMEIDPCICSIPYAYLDDSSYYFETGSFVLFSTHTIFRISEITEVEDQLWKVKLTLTNDIHQRLEIITEHVSNEMMYATAITISNMAVAFNASKQVEQAIEHAKRALDIIHQAFGPNHSQTRRYREYVNQLRERRASS
ncbi:hypothetical protein I4U23_030573 [Adineta vaga]|nr:hypothetical protein I4U23_030573 [Adineta vaga]